MSKTLSTIWFKTILAVYLLLSFIGIGAIAQSGAQSGFSSLNRTVGNAEVKLFGNDQQAFDIFGGSVATSQGKTIVGSRWADARAASNAGAAYIFSQDINGRYREDARLQPQGVAAGDEFGNAVAISGNTAVVGAFAHDGDFGRLKFEDSGAVYVYELRANGTWRLEARLEPSDASAGLGFGRSVAIENETIVIGAAGAGNNNSGAFYVYEFDQGEWVEGERIVPPNVTQYDEVGTAVAISGNRILVSGSGADDAGLAYIYRRARQGTRQGWQVEAALSAGDNRDGTFFGYALALDGDIALVGALGDDEAANDAGASYVFERQSNGDWRAAGKITAPDASRDDKFGGAVALENGLAVISAEQNDVSGTDSGAVYIYSRQSEGVWNLIDKVAAVDADRADHFGSALALAEGKLVVGALRDDDVAENSGSTYVYNISSLSSTSVSRVGSSVGSSLTTRRSNSVDQFQIASRNSASNPFTSSAVTETARPVLAPALAVDTNAPLSASELSIAPRNSNRSSESDYSEIRANNFSNQSSQNVQNQDQDGQGQFSQGQFNQGQLNQGQFNQGLGSNSGASRNLGSGFGNQGLNNQGFGNQGLDNQGLNNQGFGNQGLSNQGFGNNQGLGSGLNQGLNNNIGTGSSRNLGSGQNFSNQGFGNSNSFNNNSGNFNASPSFSNQNSNLNGSNADNQEEGFLGLGRFFRNPNRPRVEDDNTPRLSDITEQPNQNQNSGFLGLGGKLRNLGSQFRGNQSSNNASRSGLNRDTRNQGFGSQGLGNQNYGNQGLGNQSFGNQSLGNQGSNNAVASPVMNLRGQVNRVGDRVELELPLFSTPVTYLSSGLPQGLQLDTRQGIIFGQIARGTEGNYDVLIQVDDGQNQLTEGFSWQVNR